MRNLQIARGLADRGWRVTVLTTRKRLTEWSDASAAADLPANARVVRVRAPDLGALAQDVGLGRRRRAPPGAAGARGARPSGPLRDFVLTWLLIPDADAPWIPFAVREGGRQLRAGGFQALLTAGPPHSAHVVGYALRARTALRWVVDSQDPWADHPFPTHSSRVRQGIDRWLESRVFQRADVVVSATDSQTSRFQAAYADRPRRFVTLYSGYDEREFRDLEPRREDGRLLVHFGSFYGARSPAAFLTALHEVASASPELVRDLRVLFAGYADAAHERTIAAALGDATLARIVRYTPLLPRRESLERMLGAWALLLVTDPGAGGRDLVPIKTFEYLRAGRPILALVPEGETARILRRAGGSIIAHPSDVTGIRTALAALLERPERIGAPDAAVVATMDFGRSLDGLSGLLDADLARERSA